MRTQHAEKGKSPYVRHGKTPYVYQFRRCSHHRDNGKLNAVWCQTPTWHGDVCAVCNIILKNTTPRSHG